jgi:coatomer subunit epsilon
MAQNEATRSAQSLVGQAISELHLGRLPEAEAAFEQAVGLDGKSPDVLANHVVFNTVLGKSSAEQRKALQSVQPSHQLLKDLAEKNSEFVKAAARYSPRVNG